MGSFSEWSDVELRYLGLIKNNTMEKIKEKTGINGTVRVRRYRAGTIDLASPYYKAASEVKRMAEASDFQHHKDLLLKKADHYKARAQEILDLGFIDLAVEQKNLIVSSADYGKNLIAQRLAGTNTYTLNITHGEIGTGSTAPALTNTGLATGTTRRVTESASVSNNIVTLRFFFADAVLANGTYNEFGTFVDGTATLGTGKLFNRALFSTAYVKATGEDTTVDVEFDIN